MKNDLITVRHLQRTVPVASWPGQETLTEAEVAFLGEILSGKRKAPE